MAAQPLSFLQHPRLWRGRGRQPQQPAWSSGHPALDQHLPGGGWPLGALSEILHPHPGLGEISLLLPALANATQQGRSIAIIAPPLTLNGPNLSARGVQLEQLLIVDSDSDNDTRWAAEQCLRARLFAFVLAWPGRCDDRHLRRLQLAAEHGESAGILYRSSEHARQPSPAQLRLCLDPMPEPRPGGISLRLIKARGLACSFAQPQRLQLGSELIPPTSRAMA
ncbi:MAG: translesion DNA synthesis-associated protein ImuA [Xanthomonadales bacterium]|nr:translesion DNA synthesis-associated protein ImuA [Xanthomonadales bacterium]